jgi:hypothetical protein
MRIRRRISMKLATCLIAFSTLLLLACSGDAPFEPLSASPRSEAPARIPQTPCDVVTGEGHTDAAGPVTFAGFADLVVGGQEFPGVQVTTTLLGMRETDTGTLLADTSHAFGPVASPWFVTTDKARLEPTGVPGEFRLNSTMKVTAPEGMEGNLTSHGTISLIPGGNGADFDIHGTLCGN